MKITYERVTVSIDDEVIDADDPYALIEPAWMKVDIYGPVGAYERTLRHGP